MVQQLNTPADPDFLALQEALVGRYSLERELGRGGMGVVYLAHEVALDRPVALKLLPPAYAAQPALRERFLREARTAAKLSHPNIVPIHAVAEVDDFVFFSMAYIDGETLGERVRNRGPLPGKEAVRILREVAWALAYAHAEGVIHRDVKPDNILLEAGSGRALVMDFGIAHVGHEPSITGVGEVLGTAEFMSPEQAAGEEVGPESDLYALGAVGFYALTGKLPFEGPSVAAVLAKHITQPAPPVASVAPGVPAKLAQAIDRCLLKPPEERYTDGGALAEALGQSTPAERELPVPIRVFINKIRGFAASSPLILILWAAVGTVPLLGGFDEFWPMFVVLVLGSLMGPFAALGNYARRLLKAGYGVDDARLALKQDVDRRLEEVRFDGGKGATTVDRILRVTTWGGFAILVGGAIVDMSTALNDGWIIPAIGLSIWINSLFARGFRNKKRRDLVGEGLLSVFRGRVGDWLFKLGGMGLGGGILSGGGAHRPTEMAIGIAADRLFEELPKAVKRDLHALPDAIKKLESGAGKMRQQVDDLDAVLAEIGDDPGRVGADERAKLRADVEATRDESRSRMTDAVSALETIRLGLLRLHAGDGSVKSLTAELGSASELSADIERLLSGQEEVERLLKGRGSM